MTRTRLAGIVLLLSLTGLAVLRSHWGTRLDGFTVDEPWHIVAGTQYVRDGDFRLNPEHPPLVKLWVGLWQPASFAVPPPQRITEKAAERDLVERVMFLENDPMAAQQRARVAMWTLHGSLLFVLGLLLWRALGLAWAAGTLTVLALDPTVAAHLPVVMTDLALGLTLAIATVACALLASTWQWRWAAAAGAGIGLALMSKHSALAGLAGLALLLLVAVGLGLRSRSLGASAGHGPPDGAQQRAGRAGRWREVGRRALRVAAAGALGVALLWASYGLRFPAGADGSDAFNRAMPDKIADLSIPHWRAAIALADDWQLLPRAYLWGLADTVRAGVEGRGQSMHLVWGHWYEGHAPWFTWPAVLVAKLPLPVLALVLLGAAVLLVPRWRGTRLPAAAGWTLAALAAASALHLAALMDAQGTYGGVRHALPLLLALVVLAAATVAVAVARRQPPLAAASALLLAIAAATTLPEPRAWEYHNPLAGGSADAWRYFGNEGTDLGQRFPEIQALYARHVADSGLPMFSAYWFGEEQAQGAGLRYRRRVLGLDDTNVEGVYEGWFVYPMRATISVPQFGWDAEAAFEGLRLVERRGHIGLWRGRQVLPLVRAYSMYEVIAEYLYVKGGTDHALVAARLAEVQPHLPHHLGVAIELGNAHLRLGQREQAMRAYRAVLEQDRMPVEPLVRGQLEAQLARLAEQGADLAAVTPLRNPWME